MVNKIIIHFGQTKTASTSLQVFLTRNKKLLFENGVTYLDFPNNVKQFSHRYIYNLLMLNNGKDNEQKNHHKERLERLFSSATFKVETNPEQFLINSLKNCSTETGLISEELFWHLGEFDQELRRRCLNNLKDIFQKVLPDIKIKIIAYLRPQDSWLESWHNQLIKDRYLQNPIQEMFSRHLKLKVYDYSNIIDDWLNIFEPDEITIRPFVKNELLNNSIYDDFLNSGLDLAPSPDYWLPKKKFQKSLHPVVCAFVIRNRPPINSSYKKALQEMSVYAKEFRPFKNVKFTLLKDGERQKLKKETLKCNKILSKQFNFNQDLTNYFNWEKTIVPSPLPLKIRQEFFHILGQQMPSAWRKKYKRFCILRRS